MITSVIFDLNGTILSDEDEYGLAFKKVLNKLDVSVSDYPHESGIGVPANWVIFLNKYNIKSAFSILELSDMTQKEYLKISPRVTLTKGFTDFIRSLKREGKKTALATSNDRLVV